MRRLIALTALPLLLLAGCGERNDAPTVSKAWVRLAAVPGQPAAAYFTVSGGANGDALEQVASAVAQRLEMHESMAGHHGMMTMAPIKSVDVPAGTQILFAPGGRHVMVFGLDKAIAPGTAVPLRFGFASGKTAEAEAKTVAAGEAAPD